MAETSDNYHSNIEAIKELKQKYWHYIDNKLWDEVAECFAEDAVADYPNGVFQGRKAIVDSFKDTLGQGPVTHIGRDLGVEMTGDAVGRALWQAEVFMIDPNTNTEVQTMTFYEDEYIKYGDRWTIKTSRMLMTPLQLASDTSKGREKESTGMDQSEVKEQQIEVEEWAQEEEPQVQTDTASEQLSDLLLRGETLAGLFELRSFGAPSTRYQFSLAVTDKRLIAALAGSSGLITARSIPYKAIGEVRTEYEGTHGPRFSLIVAARLGDRDSMSLEFKTMEDMRKAYLMMMPYIL